MRCERMTLPGGGAAIVCGSAPRRPKCRFCRKGSSKLCDYVVGHTHTGKEITCDAPVCLDCARPDPKNANKDHCPRHQK